MMHLVSKSDHSDFLDNIHKSDGIILQLHEKAAMYFRDGRFNIDKLDALLNKYATEARVLGKSGLIHVIPSKYISDIEMVRRFEETGYVAFVELNYIASTQPIGAPEVLEISNGSNLIRFENATEPVVTQAGVISNQGKYPLFWLAAAVFGLWIIYK